MWQSLPLWLEIEAMAVSALYGAAATASRNAPVPGTLFANLLTGPGGGLPVLTKAIGKIGMLLYKDFHFPEAPSVLALRRADLAVPLTRPLEMKALQQRRNAPGFDVNASCAYRQ